jgi:hypothetical protein
MQEIELVSPSLPVLDHSFFFLERTEEAALLNSIRIKKNKKTKTT